MNMNRNTNFSLPSRLLNSTLILVVVPLLLLRFVNLNADFPLGITWSGVLYTDEGWYSNAAVRHFLSGHWYLSGDFNPAINMPIGQILNRCIFSVFGIGLSSSRIIPALSYVFIVLLTARLVHRKFGSFASILTALLLATNYIGFVFSRLALMEFVGMFFVVSSLFVAINLGEKSRRARIVFSAALLAAGILTKTTMVFAIPLLAYLAWSNAKNVRERGSFLIACAIVILFVVCGYFLVANMFFHEDFAYFYQLNLAERVHFSLGSWLHLISKTAVKVKVLGLAFVVINLAIQ